MTVVVVGNGMAGCRFAQELRARDRDVAITVIGDEPGGAYNRMLLSTVLAGSTSADDIVLATAASYAEQNITLRSATVTDLDRDARTVTLDDGSTMSYDTLVLATGSVAVGPQIDGAVVFRTLADCTAIDAIARTASTAVVVGAGVLGLEAARGLAGRGLAVHLVQRGPRLMQRQLDPEAGNVLAGSLTALGVQLAPDAQVDARGITRSDGVRVDADLIVLCCGVRPRVELAVAAGLPVGRAVVVDDQLRSVGDADVFAIGECAEHRGVTYGLVAPAWDQARIAAAVVAGETAGYSGSSVVTRLKAAGIELAALGDPDAEGDVVRYVDSARGVYQKLVVRDGRLVGAILLGDARTVGTVTQLFDRGTTVPPDRSTLLMPRRTAALQSPMSLPARTTICQCNGVSKAAICAAFDAGACTTAAVALTTRATTGCGTCRDVVDGIVEWLTAAATEEEVPA